MSVNGVLALAAEFAPPAQRKLAAVTAVKPVRPPVHGVLAYATPAMFGMEVPAVVPTLQVLLRPAVVVPMPDLITLPQVSAAVYLQAVQRVNLQVHLHNFQVSLAASFAQVQITAAVPRIWAVVYHIENLQMLLYNAQAGQKRHSQMLIPAMAVQHTHTLLHAKPVWMLRDLILQVYTAGQCLALL